MIRIAICYGKFGTSQSGGGRESLLTLLDEVGSELDIQAEVYQTPPVDDPPRVSFDYDINTAQLNEFPKFTWANQVLRRWQWKRYLEDQLGGEYDLLVTQNDLAPASVAVAQQYDIPSIFLTSSLALTGYEKYAPDISHLSNLRRTDIGGRIQYPFLWKNFHDYKWAARSATYTRASSNFASRTIESLFGAESIVIYPPIDPDQYRVQYDGDGFITMVNPRAEYKGGDIFLNLAERRPDERFLLVGPISSSTLKANADEIDNVTHWEWCDDMREAYSQSKLVVTPSRVEETFGRVPAEAMVSGIPCVVSNRGGLPEVVGDTGEVVSEIESIHSWERAIETASENHDPAAQKRRVEEFSSETQGRKLREIIKSIAV